MSTYYSSAFDRFLDSDLKDSRYQGYVKTCDLYSSPSPRRYRSPNRLSKSYYFSPSSRRYLSPIERLEELEREVRVQRRLIESMSPSRKNLSVSRSQNLSQSTASFERKSRTSSITSSPMVKYHQNFVDEIDHSLQHVDYVKSEIKEKLHDLKCDMISGRHKCYRLHPYTENYTPSRIYTPRVYSPRKTYSSRVRATSPVSARHTGSLYQSSYLSPRRNLDQDIQKEFEKGLEHVHRIKDQIEEKMYKLKTNMATGRAEFYRIGGGSYSSRTEEYQPQEVTQTYEKAKNVDQEPSAGQGNRQEPSTVKKEKQNINKEDLEATQKKNYKANDQAGDEEVNKELFGENKA
jgi:hypothetical protein